MLASLCGIASTHPDAGQQSLCQWFQLFENDFGVARRLSSCLREGFGVKRFIPSVKQRFAAAGESWEYFIARGVAPWLHCDVSR
jgi:hypothetical protein